MPDYAKAFNRGIKNAEDAERNRAEILEVIEELSQELASASKGEIVRIEVEAKDLRIGSKVLIQPALPSRSALVAIPKIRMPGRKREKATLCDVSVAASGYPVTLAYANRDVTCHDKVALASALAEMLEHPDTGRMLSSFIRETSSKSK